MRYAEVCVNSSIPDRRTFSYSIPDGLNIEVAQAVWAPFGAKILQGIVIELTAAPSVPETKEIIGVIEPRPILSPAYLSLAKWISEHYLASLFSSLSLMLPPGFERGALACLSAAIPADFDLTSLDADARLALELIQTKGKIGQKELAKAIGQQKTTKLVSRLIKQGLIKRVYELEPIKVAAKYAEYVELKIDRQRAQQEIAALRNKRAVKQALLLSFLVERTELVSWDEAREKTDASRAILRALIKQEFVAVRLVESRRDPLAARAVNLSYPLPLTSDQQTAFQDISDGLRENGTSKIFLLKGVTGSGKTEIYLQSLAEAVRLGKKGIVLVPEISLTPQTIERFSSRFPGRVAVLHSRLSIGEQFDEWRRIKNGEADVVIGPRSAIFAPQRDLGIIILDEEHEWTYKQSDISPRYHARDAAIKLAELTGAAVVLGSATPDVESSYHAQQGDYRLLELPERVTPYPNAPLPPVEVIDMREELKTGNRSMFSRALAQAIMKAVNGGEQVMLFLNRRGGATFIQCRDCGYVLTCRRCDAPLSYHPGDDILLCHQCNYRRSVPQTCPSCGSRRIKFLGTGTEKLEQEAAAAFPKARLLRWDSDTTQAKDAHQQIMNKFRSHEADILIGTQMIAKGLDLPQVTLVGVVNADTALHLPDFRSGERTFQLLSQVAGRAGRGALGGRVIFQTYTPENYAIQTAAEHNYAAFYAREIEYRRMLNNPPFSRLASLVFNHTNDEACRLEAERMKKLLSDEIAARGISGIGIIGPAPAFIRRLRGRFRWQMILRGADPSAFISGIPVPQGWVIDIDPIGL